MPVPSRGGQDAVVPGSFWFPRLAEHAKEGKKAIKILVFHLGELTRRQENSILRRVRFLCHARQPVHAHVVEA